MLHVSPPPNPPFPSTIGLWTPSPASSIFPLVLLQSAPPPTQETDLADSGHSGRAELVEELKFAGRLFEEEVDDLSRRDGCHKGGVRCGGIWGGGR